MNDEPQTVAKVEEKLNQAFSVLKEAVDLSIQIRQNKSPEVGSLNRNWEQFLGNFLGYIRQRGKETRQNLLSGIKFPRF